MIISTVPPPLMCLILQYIAYGILSLLAKPFHMVCAVGKQNCCSLFVADSTLLSLFIWCAKGCECWNGWFWSGL